MNAINTIYPYREHGVSWVFDDAQKDLYREAFVSGADDIIDILVRRLNGKPDKGFKLTFAENEFPSYDVRLVWSKSESSGNTYVVTELRGKKGTLVDMVDLGLAIEGWLCPALLRYFDKPPKSIYARVQSCLPVKPLRMPRGLSVKSVTTYGPASRSFVTKGNSFGVPDSWMRDR